MAPAISRCDESNYLLYYVVTRMSRRTTLPEPWLSMSVAAGGVAELVQLLDIDQMTLWRWTHTDARPSKIVRSVVNGWATRRGIEAPFVEEEGQEPAKKPAMAKKARK